MTEESDRKPRHTLADIAAASMPTMRTPDLCERLAGQGFIPPTSSPQAFAEHVVNELIRFRKLVQSAGITLE